MPQLRQSSMRLPFVLPMALAAAVLCGIAGCGTERTIGAATPTPTESSVTSVRISLSLFHCGINPVTVDGRVWRANPDDELLSATNEPETWVGSGTAVIDGDRLIYTDDGGIMVPFEPDDGTPPPPCR